MRSLFWGLLLGAPLACQASHDHTTHTLATDYKVDVHSHVIPPIWKDAMIAAGFPVKNGTLYADGFPVPDWTLEGHISAMDSVGVNYSAISVSAPGVYFLKNSGIAKYLARAINLELFSYVRAHPDRLGALCLLPLPFVEEAVEELKYCLELPEFVGVGLFTNADGTYLGDSALDPVFAALDERNASVFVHPAAPGCNGVSLGYPIPMSEYPFDTVRAMENMLLTGQRAKFPDLKMIFAHGGGAIPYLATRIAGMASLSWVGGLSVTESLAQLAGYYFDTASASSAIQLAALKSFIGVKQIVTGTDYPYIPLAQAQPAVAAIQSNGNFSAEDMSQINHGNALEVFPRIKKALGI